MAESKLQWYGYKHTNGTIHLRLFRGDYGVLIELMKSGFAAQYVGPFVAENREAAQAFLEKTFV